MDLEREDSALYKVALWESLCIEYLEIQRTLGTQDLKKRKNWKKTASEKFKIGFYTNTQIGQT